MDPKPVCSWWKKYSRAANWMATTWYMQTGLTCSGGWRKQKKRERRTKKRWSWCGWSRRCGLRGGVFSTVLRVVYFLYRSHTKTPWSWSMVKSPSHNVIFLVECGATLPADRPFTNRSYYPKTRWCEGARSACLHVNTRRCRPLLSKSVWNHLRLSGNRYFAPPVVIGRRLDIWLLGKPYSILWRTKIDRFDWSLFDLGVNYCLEKWCVSIF